MKKILYATTVIVLTASGIVLAEDIQVGPIWSNADAQNICPSACQSHNMSWTGQWRTIRENVASVCGCE